MTEENEQHGLVTIRNKTMLDERDVMPHWVYITTCESIRDNTLIYELWNISGGCAVYDITNDLWMMLDHDKHWTQLGYRYTTTPESIDEITKKFPFGFWQLEDGKWFSYTGRQDVLDYVEKTNKKETVRH